jgi:hypothetical protein
MNFLSGCVIGFILGVLVAMGMRECYHPPTSTHFESDAGHHTPPMGTGGIL